MNTQTPLDRRLIGALARRLILERGSISSFSRKGMSRATLHRVFEGNEQVTIDVFARIESDLQLAPDTLTLVGLHQFDLIQTEHRLGEKYIAWLTTKDTQTQT